MFQFNDDFEVFYFRGFKKMPRYSDTNYKYLPNARHTQGYQEWTEYFRFRVQDNLGPHNPYKIIKLKGHLHVVIFYVIYKTTKNKNKISRAIIGICNINMDGSTECQRIKGHISPYHFK